MSELQTLIKKAVSIPKKENPRTYQIPNENLQAIVSYCQTNDNKDTYENIWYYLSNDLLHSNLHIRRNALELVDIIMHISEIFRFLINQNIQTIANCGGLIPSQRNISIIYPDSLVNEVKQRIELWDLLYGHECAQIHTIRRYLVESLGLKMPNLERKAREYILKKDKKQFEDENLILLKTKKMIQMELLPTIRAISTAKQTIQECFAILFPRFQPLEFNSTFENYLNSGGSKLTDTLLPSTTSSSSKPQSSVDFPIDDNWDDVAWETEQSIEETYDSFIEKAIERAKELNLQANLRSDIQVSTYGSLPQTIEINLKTKAKDIANEDNRVLLESIRELAEKLIKFDIPELKQWLKLCNDSLDILQKPQILHEYMIVDSNTGKRKLDQSMSSSQPQLPTRPLATKDIPHILNAKDSLIQLISELKIIILDQCKELFDEST